jgi:Rieske Fe-S protein
MHRRIFLSAGLALLGFVRHAWAQLADSSSSVRYAILGRPVTIPVDSVATPWKPVAFVAESRFREKRVLINGVLLRTDTALSALCVTCPHEQCQVDLVTDEARLARMVDGKASNPLFECGCHFSVFDAAREGARISGESPRGLYRFRINAIREGVVEITEIEETALSEV